MSEREIWPQMRASSERATWQAELERRVDETLSGEAQLVSGEESRARVRALLAELNE